MFRLIVLGGLAYFAWRTIRETARKREVPSDPPLLLPPRAARRQGPLIEEQQEPQL